VRSTRRISRSTMRIELDGEGLAGFDPAGWTDAYVNAYFPPPDFAYDIPFDVDVVKSLPAEQRPPSRRYSVRAWDADACVLTVDFVVHGDTGVAGPWALRAQPGDLLQFNAPSGGYRPDPAADWHLMVGDESALPAIAASLAVLPAGALVHAFLEVDGPADELDLPTAGDLHLVWLHREAHPGRADLLLGALKAFQRPAGRVQAFVHGEAVGNRELRRYLLTDWALPRADLSVSPYWRRGDTDESWRKVRKAWLAEVESEV
jgi:NADPH-dependent ferric siderophore reductase